MADANITGPEEERDPLYMGSDIGISDEDKKDVMSRIDQIASENRISVSADHFTLKDIRQGNIFPVLVNAITLVILAAGLIVLGVVFKGDQRSMSRNSIEYSSIEGQLIRELRRESQARISEKDQLIKEVNDKIQELENERDNLQANLEIKVQQRQEEYNEQIQQQVEAEKQRLESRGIAPDEMDRLLTLYEAKLRKQYDAQLAEYRSSLEAEQAEVENNMNNLINEYQSQISDLQNERQSLLADFRSQEDSLRTQLEQRTKVLENANAQAVQNLADARQQLSLLEIQKQQNDIIENQLLGFYGRIQGAFARSAWEEASTAIDQAVDFLNQDQIVASNALTARRTTDLFILASLKNYSESRQKDVEQTATIGRQLAILSRIKLNDQQASEALARDDEAAANALYSDTMTLMSELGTANQALVQDALVAYQGQLQEELTARAGQIEAILTQAEAQVSAGSYNQALASFDAALALLPEFETSGKNFNSALIDLGYSVGDIVVLNDNAGAFSPIVQRAQLSVDITRDTIANRTKAAVQKREDELFAELAKSDSALNDATATYEQRLAEQQQNSTQLEQQISSLEDTRTQLQTRVDQLNSEVSRLQQFEKLLSTVSRQYQDYRTTEQNLLAGADSQSLDTILSARQTLENFIGSRELSGIFPGFADSFRNSDAMLQDAGRDLGLGEALDILSGMFGQSTADQQKLYIENEIKLAKDDNDSTLESFLNELSLLIGQ